MRERFKYRARQMLRLEEGERKLPYTDTVGKTTIGVGRNLSDKGISKHTIDQMLEEDLLESYIALCKIFGLNRFDSWSLQRRLGLINMIFNLGETRFRKFERMIDAIKSGDWTRAALEALDSKWSRQLPGRSVRVAKMLEDG